MTFRLEVVRVGLVVITPWQYHISIRLFEGFEIPNATFVTVKFDGAARHLYCHAIYYFPHAHPPAGLVTIDGDQESFLR